MNVHMQEQTKYHGAGISEAKAFVLSLHGRNHSPDIILEIADRIGLDGVHYAAPQAFQNSWYPERFMEPIEKNEPFLTYSLEVCRRQLQQWTENGVPTEKIVLMGFSQGACLAAEYAIRNPERYGGLLIFTGALIGPEGTKWADRGSFEGTSVFLGTSDEDEWIPVERVHETEAIFIKRGAQTDKRIYKGMGHLVNDDEIDAARSLLKGIINAESDNSMLMGSKNLND
ncbi:alpha/beta hydrolase [Peribacillus glennii]|uniref:Phospholipase n=1 Tax=Peribacillus glennii TaxID=2303991 RepID=A0A372LFK5_9BACI|nr:alpha/beta hydrolase-fold protein [Peribacillus glennii]RFU65103.1 phospholipase [Peribacillus glennii]